MKMQHTSRCSNCLGHIAYVQLGRRASPVSPSRPGPQCAAAPGRNRRNRKESATPRCSATWKMPHGPQILRLKSGECVGFMAYVSL